MLQTFQLTITHSLGFSVFTSHILATDLSESHCNFKSHLKFSLHRLISFVSFLLNHRLPSPELDPILSTTVVFSSTVLLLLLSSRTLLITILHGPHGKHRLLLTRMRIFCSVTWQWMLCCRVCLCCGNVYQPVA
jgi:hypothetical protein